MLNTNTVINPELLARFAFQMPTTPAPTKRKSGNRRAQRADESFSQWQERISDNREKTRKRMQEKRKAVTDALSQNATANMLLHGMDQSYAVAAAIPTEVVGNRMVQSVADSLRFRFAPQSSTINKVRRPAWSESAQSFARESEKCYWYTRERSNHPATISRAIPVAREIRKHPEYIGYTEHSRVDVLDTIQVIPGKLSRTRTGCEYQKITFDFRLRAFRNVAVESRYVVEKTVHADVHRNPAYHQSNMEVFTQQERMSPKLDMRMMPAANAEYAVPVSELLREARITDYLYRSHQR